MTTIIPVYRLFVNHGDNVQQVVASLVEECERSRNLIAGRFAIIMIPGGRFGSQMNFVKELKSRNFDVFVSLTHSVRSTLMNLTAQVVAQSLGPDTVIGFMNPAATKSRLTEEVAKNILWAFAEPGVEEVGVGSTENPSHDFVRLGFADAGCHFIRARAVLEVPYHPIADDPAFDMPVWNVVNLKTEKSFRLHGAEDSMRVPKPGSYAWVSTTGEVYSGLMGFGGDTRIQDFKLLRAFLNSEFAKIGRGIDPNLLPKRRTLNRQFRTFVTAHLEGVHPKWRTKEVEALASRLSLPSFTLERA